MNVMLCDHDVMKPSMVLTVNLYFFLQKQPRLPEIAIKALTLMYITMPKIFLAIETVLAIAGLVCVCYSLKQLYDMYEYNRTAKNMIEISSALDKKCNIKVQIPLIVK